MHKVMEITKLIQANLWTVCAFAYARPAISELLEQKFSGTWDFLDTMVGEIAEVRADRALLELATQLRVLDDMQNLNDHFMKTSKPPLGIVRQANGNETDLYFRDTTNKVIHASAFRWELLDGPKIVCVSNDPERWHSADIQVECLMYYCGQLAT